MTLGYLTFGAMIAQYGKPHEWDVYNWFINKWRLLGEQLSIRLLVDVAMQCPVDEIAKRARDQFDPSFIDLEQINLTWPGRAAARSHTTGFARTTRSRAASSLVPCTRISGSERNNFRLEWADWFAARDADIANLLARRVKPTKTAEERLARAEAVLRRARSR